MSLCAGVVDLAALAAEEFLWEMVLVLVVAPVVLTVQVLVSTVPLPVLDEVLHLEGVEIPSAFCRWDWFVLQVLLVLLLFVVSGMVVVFLVQLVLLVALGFRQSLGHTIWDG